MSWSTEMLFRVVAKLFCRETPAERLGWAQWRKEEAAKWTVMHAWHTNAGTGSNNSSSASPHIPSSLPPSAATVKAGKGTWQVELGGGMMASAQRWGLRLLKNRAASRQRPGVSRQSNTTQFVCVCACKLKRNVMRVYEIKTCHLSIPSF